MPVEMVGDGFFVAPVPEIPGDEPEVHSGPKQGTSEIGQGPEWFEGANSQGCSECEENGPGDDPVKRECREKAGGGGRKKATDFGFSVIVEIKGLDFACQKNPAPEPVIELRLEQPGVSAGKVAEMEVERGLHTSADHQKRDEEPTGTS